MEEAVTATVAFFAGVISPSPVRSLIIRYYSDYYYDYYYYAAAAAKPNGQGRWQRVVEGFR